MKSPTLFFRFIGLGKPLSLLLLSTSLLAGCASTTTPALKEEKPPVATQAPAPQEIPVTRYNRYTLVEVGATADQKDLLAQIIDVPFPVSAKQPATVADAMAYVLLNSGYQLCGDEAIAAFRGFQLPIAHHHLGPISVKDALSTLAGPGWQLLVDHQSRLVCFSQLDKAKEVQP